jgi:hypothetical protein
MTFPDALQGFTVATSSDEPKDDGQSLHFLNFPETASETAEDSQTSMGFFIDVYPLAQWTAWQKNDFVGYPSADPNPPTEVGYNSKYAFVFSAREIYGPWIPYDQANKILATLKGF